MDYNLIITRHAEQLLDEIVQYLLFHLSNPEAAASLLDDLSQAYETLRKSGGSFALCQDPYLASKDYRKLKLKNHDYVIVYKIMDKNIRIDGIFHTLENYGDKL